MRIKAGLKRLTLLLLTVFTLTLGSAALVQDTFAADKGGTSVSAGQVRIRIGRQRHYRYYRDRDDRWYQYHHRRYHRYHRWYPGR